MLAFERYVRGHNKFRIYLNPLFATEIIYDYQNELTSIAEYSLDQSEIISHEGSFGRYSASISGHGGGSLDLLKLKPSDILCVTAVNSANNTASATASLNWVEDL